MNQERETPKFQGIADPKCKCTPDRLCRRCSDHGREVDARIFFRGKFREPWNSAVKKNNIEIKNEGRGDR
jgi:hypothetical protein